MATPGPWTQTYGHGDTGNNNNVVFGTAVICRFVWGRGNGGEPEAHVNAQFIASSRVISEKLIAVAKAAKSLRDNYGGEARDCDLDDLDEALKALEAE